MTPPPHVSVFLQTRDALVKHFRQYREMVINYQSAFENPEITPEMLDEITQGQSVDLIRKEFLVHRVQLSSMLLDYIRLFSNAVLDLSPSEALEQFDTSFGLISRVAIDRELFPVQHVSLVLQHAITTSARLLASIVKADPAAIASSQLASPRSYQSLFTFLTSFLDTWRSPKHLAEDAAAAAPGHSAPAPGSAASPVPELYSPLLLSVQALLMIADTLRHHTPPPTATSTTPSTASIATPSPILMLFLRGPLTPSLHLVAHKLLELATQPRCERALAVQALQTLVLLREYLGGEAPVRRWVEREDTRREIEKLAAFLQDANDGDSFFGEDKDSQAEVSSGKSESGKYDSGYKVSDSVLPLSVVALEAVPVLLLRQRLAALKQLARRHVTTLTYTPPSLTGTPTRASTATTARLAPAPASTTPSVVAPSTTSCASSDPSSAPVQPPAAALVTARDTHLLATNILAGMLPGVLSAAAQLLSRGRLHHTLACAAVQVWAGFIVGVCADRELALLGINPETGKRVSTEFSQRSSPSAAAASASSATDGAGGAALPSGVASFLSRMQRSQASAAHAEQPQPLFAASSTPAASDTSLSHARARGEAVNVIMDTFPLPSDSSSTDANSAMTITGVGAADEVLQHFLPPSLASLAHSPLFPVTKGDALATIVARGLTRSPHTRAGKTAAQTFLEQLATGKNPSELEDGDIPGLDAEGAWVGVRTQQWLCESRARISGYIAQLYSPVQQPQTSGHDGEEAPHTGVRAGDAHADGSSADFSTGASASRTSAPAAPLSAGAHGYTVALMVSSAYLLLVHCPVFLHTAVPPLLDCIVGNVYSAHAFVAARAVATIRTLNTTGQLARALRGYSAHRRMHARTQPGASGAAEAERGDSDAQSSRAAGKELLSMLKHRESALRNNSLSLNSEQGSLTTSPLAPNLDISRYSALANGSSTEASPVSVLTTLLRQRLFWLPSVMRQELSTQQLLAVRLITGYVVVLGSFEQQQQQQQQQQHQAGVHAHTPMQPDFGWASSMSSSASPASLSSLFTSSLHVVLPSLLEAVAINVHDAAMLDVGGDAADSAFAFAQTRFLLAGSHDVRKALGQLCEALGAYVPAVLPLLEQVSAEIARAVAQWGDPSAEVDMAALAAEAIGARGGNDRAGNGAGAETDGRSGTPRDTRRQLLLAADNDGAEGAVAQSSGRIDTNRASDAPEAAVNTEEELTQRVQAAVASLSAVPAEGFGGLSQRLIQMLTAAKDKRYGHGAADGSHTGFSARSSTATAPSAARYEYLCELCFLLGQLCLGLQRRVAYHAQMGLFHVQQQRHRAHVEQLRTQQASQGVVMLVRAPPAPAPPAIAAQFLLPPPPPPALALLTAPVAAAQAALLSVFTLPTAPVRLAAEARYLVAHVAQRQLQPGLLYNADTYAHAQVAQAQAARACALLMSVLPPLSRVPALPRLLGPLLQAAQVSSAALQTNAQAALLFVARLCQFSSVEGLVRSYADQIVAELTTELSVMKTRTELEEAYRAGKIPGFSHSEAENPVSFGHTIVDVAEAVKRCRAAHDACKAAFGAVMVAAMATPQLTHVSDADATDEAARAGVKGEHVSSNTGMSTVFPSTVGTRTAPSDRGAKLVQRPLIEEVDEAEAVAVPAAAGGLPRGVLIEEVDEAEEAAHMASDATATLLVASNAADSQRVLSSSGAPLVLGQHTTQTQTQTQALAQDRVDTATPSAYTHAQAQAHAEASQALSRALREWREATRAAQRCIERYERAQARFERLPRLLVSTLTVTQHTIDAGTARTSHDIPDAPAHVNTAHANASQQPLPSAPSLGTLGAPSPAAPMDMVPLLREALLQSVECLGSVLNKLQRLPKHIREWEIHANIEPGKMYFSGNLLDSQFSGAFGGESHAFSSGPREFVDPARASSRASFQRHVNAGDLSGVQGLALPPAEAARAWAQRAQCESDILRYLAMVLSICRAIYSRASYLWRRRRRVFALEYCRRWRGREMRRQWAERWALRHGNDGAATETIDTAPVTAGSTSTTPANATTADMSPSREHMAAARDFALQPALTTLQAQASSSALVSAPASVEELVAAQRRARHVRLPAEDGIANMAVDVYVSTSTIASAHADPHCTVLVDAEGIHLPRKDDIRKTVASFRSRLTSRVQRVREQEQERDRYARARAQGAGATDMARVWWEELEQQRAREAEEKQRMGTLEDIGGDINYTAEDGTRPADVEYDSDFDEEVTVGRQMTRAERREVKRYQQGQWRGDEPSAFDTEYRRLRVAFKKETELSEAQRARVRTQGASRKSRPKSDGSSRVDADRKKSGKGAESAPVSKFGVHIAVVEDDDEDAEEVQEVASTAAVSSTHDGKAGGDPSTSAHLSVELAAAYDDPRCPYLPPGQDPYLDDPYWITPPTQDAGAVAEDGTREPSAEEALLERVLQQLQPLLLWPSVALRSKAAEVNCVAVAALGICGRVWPEMASSGGFSGTVLSVREIIRERKRAERAALRKLQGLPEKKKNRFAGMVYGREGWSVDEPEPDTDDDAEFDAENESVKSTKASTPVFDRSLGNISAGHADTGATTKTADDGEHVSSECADAELQEWDFYNNPEKTIFPDEIPEPPLPVQHDIRLLPILSSLWLSLRFLLSPQHAILTDKHPDGDGTSPAPFNPTLGSSLALLAVVVAASPNFLASRFTTEVWPALQRLLLRCAALALPSPRALATDRYTIQHAHQQSYAAAFPPSHSPVYRVLVLCLCALRHCLLTADTARPLAAPILHTVLPFMAPHVPAEVRALVASIVAVIYVHDAATVTAMLHNICLALGVSQLQLEALTAAVAHAAAPTTGDAKTPAGGSHTTQRLARSYATYEPPQPLVADSAVCPVNSLTRLNVSVKSTPAAAYEAPACPAADSTVSTPDANGAPSCPQPVPSALVPCPTTVTFIRPAPWLRGFAALTEAVEQGRIVGDGSCALAIRPARLVGSRLSAARAPVSNTVDLAQVSLQVYHQLQHAHGRMHTPQRASAVVAQAAEIEASVHAGFASVLCVAELLSLLDQVKTGQLIPSGYYGSHL